MRALLLATVLFGATTGCSVAVDDGDAPSEGVELRQQEGDAWAELSVERVVASDGEVRSYVSARFVSVSGDLDRADARRVIGAGQQAEHQAAEGCSFGAVARVDGLPTLGDGSIELLDIGDVSLRVDAQVVVPLVARAFPDVGELVSGVVYTTRGADAPLPDATTYWLDVEGAVATDGSNVARDVALQVAAPRGLGAVGVAQTSLGQLGIGTQRFSDDLLIVAAGEDLHLSWSAGDHAEGDFLVVSLQGDGEGQTLQCLFEDNGSATIPGRQMSFTQGEDLELVVHRLRRTRVKLDSPLSRQDLPALTEAIVWFDFAMSARAAVQ